MNCAGTSPNSDYAFTAGFERGHSGAAAKTCAARFRDLQGEASWFEPSIARTVAGVPHLRRQVGKALTRLVRVEQFDVRQAPAPLVLDQLALPVRSLIGQGGEQVALVTKSEADALVELVEERDALADQLDLLRIVELKPEGTGGDRGRQGREGRPFFQDDRLEAGALREECGGATDDAAADDDQVGGFGR